MFVSDFLHNLTTMMSDSTLILQTDNIVFIINPLSSDAFAVQAVDQCTKQYWSSAKIDKALAKTITGGAFVQPMKTLRRLVEDGFRKEKGVVVTLQRKVRKLGAY